MTYDLKMKCTTDKALVRKLFGLLNEMADVCDTREMNPFHVGMYVGQMMEIVDQLEAATELSCES